MSIDERLKGLKKRLFYTQVGLYTNFAVKQSRLLLIFTREDERFHHYQQAVKKLFRAACSKL